MPQFHRKNDTPKRVSVGAGLMAHGLECACLIMAVMIMILVIDVFGEADEYPVTKMTIAVMIIMCDNNDDDKPN